MKIDTELLIKLKQVEKLLENDFPTEDINKIEEDIIKDSEEHYFTGDFDSYCSLICGSLDYVLSNKRIPRNQRKLLNKDFFTLFPEYQNLKEHLQKYPDFARELNAHEKMRKLLLEIK
ncbi:YxiJ family protein [Niallia sp. 01092]|uniref:YxiJ family protein n=1 Tax=unclassified Niallia TaxID=2837522 RepID=UPI003FD22AD5